MRRRLTAVPVVLGLAAGWLLLLVPAAHAACHIAAFMDTDVQASESAGVVSLTVELQGRVGSCAGTVDVNTVDGTAVAGQHYEAVSQTLTFEENDDRVETVDVTILAGAGADGGGTFTVELSNPTGSISATGGPATVTIVGNGDGPTDDDDTGEDVIDDVDGEAVGESNGGDAADESGGTIGIVLAVIAALAIGVGAFALLRGRGE